MNDGFNHPTPEPVNPEPSYPFVAPLEWRRDLRDVQSALLEWHAQKYPTAAFSDIGMKLAEEAGEVCRALDRIHYAKSVIDAETWRMNLTEEIGDVAVVLMVLCNRAGLVFEEVARERAAAVMARGTEAS